MTAILETHGLTVQFGGITALDRVDFTMTSGQLCGLIGPNGAGKTSFIDAVCGFVVAEGRVVFDGMDISSVTAHRRTRLGLCRTFQSVELFDDLDVLGNLEVGVASSGWRSVLRDLASPRQGHVQTAAVDRAIDLAGLGQVLHCRPTQLSPALRRMVGIGRALALEPKLLLLDEPAAGLDRSESQELGGRLDAIRSTGVTILLVDHDTDLVFSCCDAIYVLDRGAVMASGCSADVRADDGVVAAYLGRPFGDRDPVG